MVTSSNSFGSEDENTHAPSRCEDAPCCGCCPSATEYYDPSDEIEADLFDGDDCTQDLGEEDGDDNMTDGEADADALASAGWGTDEDYGSAEDSFLDSHWESMNECEGDF
jgi:hypothetical protein